MAVLDGLSLLVTRPPAQADAWAGSLQALGAQVAQVPLLDIVPVSDDAQIQAVKNCILDLDLYQKVIFVSQNAVAQGLEWIDRYWPQLPMGVEFYAVGETTARLLLEQGIPVCNLAQSQQGAMTSEALLEAPELQQVAGEKIAIFRGLGGRPHLGEVLSERGARVTYCELYERRLPALAAQALHNLLSVAPVQVITLHSGEVLENLYSLLQQDSTLMAQVQNDIWLLLPSQRVLVQAQTAGFRKTLAAQNATDTCMLQGLIELKDKLTKV